jgi:hypothetical protein
MAKREERGREGWRQRGRERQNISIIQKMSNKEFFESWTLVIEQSM